MARRRRPSFLSPAVDLRRLLIRKVVLGENPAWRAVAVLIFGRQLLQRLFGRNPEVVAFERLDPGQSIQITALPPAARSSRRR